jgi:Tfp pilus assembly protein PilO
MMLKHCILYILKNHKFFCGSVIIVLLLNSVLYLSLIKNQKEEISTLQQVYSQKRRAGRSSPDYKISQYLAIRESILTFKEYIPEVSEFAESIKELDTVLHEPGLLAGKRIFKPTRIDTLSLWKYSTSFSVKGKYSNLKSLLANIQNLPGLFCIEKLALQNRSKKTEQMEMTLTIATYFR